MDYSSEIDDHVHCDHCFLMKCFYPKCKVSPCPECRMPLHGCKLEDHLLICPKEKVPCINACFGCSRYLRRDRISSHLQHCCASVVSCSVQWNRRVLSGFAKRKMKRMARRLEKWKDTVAVDSSEIDVCEALTDQRLLLESYRAMRTDRKRLTDFQNPVHPLLPLRLPLDYQNEFDDTDSSDEENRKKAEQLKKKKSPFENCYLCKIDPTSQHLHKLGNMMEEKAEAVVENTKPKFSPIPPFYEARNLYLHLVREHLASFLSKEDEVLYPHKGLSVYSFLCSHCFRRDEYDEHYELLHMNSEDYIGRCPMYSDGCSFYYHKKTPTWGTLKYSNYLSSVVHCPPVVHSEAEMQDESRCSTSLWELPTLALDKIVGYLDSCSLGCLSCTNKYFRLICFTRYASSAMVNIKWEKLASGIWTERCYMLEFSKSQGRIHGWEIASKQTLCQHLESCGLKPKAYDKNAPERVPLPFMNEILRLMSRRRRAF